MSAGPPVFRSRWLDPSPPLFGENSLVPDPTETTETLFGVFVGAGPSRIQPEKPSPAALELDAGNVFRLDEAELLRRRVLRRDRTLADLAGRYCPECGFSAWAVSARGDASCYGCRLLARGITPRCARCKRTEWRSGDGRRVCRYCEAARFAGGNSRVAAPSPIARPEPTSREVSEPGGAA